MTVNDKKSKTPEDIINEMVGGFLNAFTDAATESAKPEVDHLKEASRLLKRAEEAADSGTTTGFARAEAFTKIADRHIRIIETALAYQK